jgi:hypothetical protein
VTGVSTLMKGKYLLSNCNCTVLAVSDTQQVLYVVLAMLALLILV